MEVLTGEAVISAIAVALYENINVSEIKKIYKNKSIQGMESPCAYIHQLNVEHTPGMRNRGQRDYMVDVRLHPPSGETRIQSWGFNLAEKVSSALQVINVAGPIKARTASWNITDDVAHVIVTYRFNVLKDMTIENSTRVLMETLEYKERVK